MSHALSLLEFSSVAPGVLAVDGMLKNAPVALLRCGSVQPGRYLVLVGGSVASVDEAHTAGRRIALQECALVDDVFLPDPHPALVAAVRGERTRPRGEAVGVFEVGTSPGLLRALDAVLKSVPVGLVELRLADDLGGHALGIVDGRLPDVQEALELVPHRVISVRNPTAPARQLASSLLPRVDETLREVLAAGTRFSSCAPLTPAGAETLTKEG